MKMNLISKITLLSAVCGGLLSPAANAQEEKPVFSSATVDLGIVVGDMDASVKFYTEALGVKEVKGFTASAEKASGFGLTDNLEAVIRVFVLGDGPGATKLKLMSFPESKPAKPDQKFIHSTIGVSYLTIRVTDMDVALKRLADSKVKLMGKTPATVSGKTYLTTVQDPDGNFIELIGPRAE